MKNSSFIIFAVMMMSNITLAEPTHIECGLQNDGIILVISSCAHQGEETCLAQGEIQDEYEIEGHINTKIDQFEYLSSFKKKPLKKIINKCWDLAISQVVELGYDLEKSHIQTNCDSIKVEQINCAAILR